MNELERDSWREERDGRCGAFSKNVSGASVTLPSVFGKYIQRTKILMTEQTCHKTRHYDIKLLNVVETEYDK